MIRESKPAADNPPVRADNQSANIANILDDL